MNSILSDRKELLRRAVFCVIESIRKDQDKYGPLIYYNDDINDAFSISPPISPIAAYDNREYYPSSYTYSQGQQHYLTKDSFRQGYIDMLNEESKNFSPV